MIWSPNLQIGLSFDKNFPEDDIGDAGIIWSPNQGSTNTIDGVFGDAYYLDGTNKDTDSNALVAAEGANQGGTFEEEVTSHLTVACWYYKTTAYTSINYAICSFDYWSNNADSRNYGWEMQILHSGQAGSLADSPIIVVRSQFGGTMTGSNMNRGRWAATAIDSTFNEWNFVCFTRTPTETICYHWNDTNGWQTDNFTYSTVPSYVYVSSAGHYVVGGRKNRGVSTWGNLVNNQRIDNFQVWSKALSEADVKRVFQGMPPSTSSR